jgi:Phage tail tube protein
MPIGSGLNSQIGIVKESVVNTPAVVTVFTRALAETLDARITTAVDMGLAGNLDIFASRRIITGKDGGGDITFNMTSKGMGRWLQAMLGSTPTATQIGTSGAYTQFHNLGSADGVTWTIQKGTPQNGGTVAPRTFSGSKVTAWEISAAANGLLQLKVTVDSMQVQPTGAGALGPQTATYTVDQNFGFNNCAWSTFSAMTVVSGQWTPTTPTALKVRNMSIKGGQPKKVDDWYAGSTIKGEQLGNAFTQSTGSIDIDYTSDTFDTAYQAGTVLGLQMAATGAVVGTSGTNVATIACTMPAVTLEQGSTPKTSGPDIVTVTYPFTIYNDGTNGSMQVSTISTDTTV